MDINTTICTWQLAREHCDWITGINLTRLFTILYGAGNVLAIGRVMTPTLQTYREQEIEGFQKAVIL